MWYCIQAVSYLICPCHPGWAAGVPNPAVSCQHCQHTLEEGRAGISKPRYCIPETHLEGCSHHCPDIYLASTPLCHPRITLYHCTLPWGGIKVPTLRRARAIPSRHCPSAPLGPHPVPRNPSERLILGKGGAADARETWPGRDSKEWPWKQDLPWGLGKSPSWCWWSLGSSALSMLVHREPQEKGMTPPCPNTL